MKKIYLTQHFSCYCNYYSYDFWCRLCNVVVLLNHLQYATIKCRSSTIHNNTCSMGYSISRRFLKTHEVICTPSSLVAMQHPIIQLQVYFLLFNHLRTRSSPPNVSTTDAYTSIQCYNRPVTTASRYLNGSTCKCTITYQCDSP